MTQRASRPYDRWEQFDAWIKNRVIVAGGEFIASIPVPREIKLDVTHLPANAVDTGYGEKVRRESDAHLRAVSVANSWLREYPPRVSWFQDYPATEMDLDDAIVRAVIGSVRAEGVQSGPGGLNS